MSAPPAAENDPTTPTISFAATAEAALRQAIATGDARGVAICPEPIFVIGSPRSATTSLAWALAAHSHLWTSPESQILVDLFGHGELDRNYQRPVSPPGYSWLRRQDVSREEFLAYLGLGLNALFTSRSGGLRWIDHTPRHTLMVDDLIGLFPGAQFIHSLRDGRDVVASMLHKAFIGRGPQAVRIRRGSQLWRQHVEAALQAAQRHPDRCLTIRYEALVADPERVFAAMQTHLRLPHETAPVEEFHNRGAKNSSFGRRGVPKLTSSEPGARWAEWSRIERGVFAREAGELMVRCGYITEDELNQWRW